MLVAQGRTRRARQRAVRLVDQPRAAPDRARRGRRRASSCALQLKLLADVGLVGFPNAGKSTLISRISAARPKIADYPFTTLAPNLGVVTLSGDRSFVVADVPGLIEGAHEGHGLGHQFLRHIERTKVLVHLVDVSGASGRDPVEDFDTIIEELRLFSPKVAAKPQIVAANKIDALDDPARSRRSSGTSKKLDLPFFRDLRPSPAKASTRCSKRRGARSPRCARCLPLRTQPRRRRRGLDRRAARPALDEAAGGRGAIA